MFFLILSIANAIKALELTPTPTPVPISVHVDMMKTTIDTSSSKCEIKPYSCSGNNLKNPKCGRHCWTSSNTDYFEYTFTGDKFQVYGTKASNHRKFELYLDDTLIETINEENSN